MSTELQLGLISSLTKQVSIEVIEILKFICNLTVN